VIRVAVRAHRQHRSRKMKLQDFDIRRGIGPYECRSRSYDPPRD
jgi:hypothetical protein